MFPTPAPSSTRGFKGARRREASRDVPCCAGPKAAPGCPEPAPAAPRHSRCCSTQRSPPSARSCSHTNPPRRSGRRKCSASSAPWGKGEQQVSAGHRGAQGCTPKGDPAPHTCGSSTEPYPATKGSSSSQHTCYCSIVPLSPLFPLQELQIAPENALEL